MNWVEIYIRIKYIELEIWKLEIKPNSSTTHIMYTNIDLSLLRTFLYKVKFVESV